VTGSKAAAMNSNLERNAEPWNGAQNNILVQSFSGGMEILVHIEGSYYSECFI
jgi:hypothetical protein